METRIPQQFHSLAHLPGTLALLREAIVHYKKNFGVFFLINALPSIITGGLYFGLLALFPFIQNIFEGNSSLLFFILPSSAVILFAMLFIFQSWGQLALLTAGSSATPTVLSGYRESFRILFPYWWLISLIGAACIAGLIFFVIPAILFGIWFSLAVPVMITEKERGLSAMLKSRAYIKGNWWKVWWRFIAFTLIVFIVSVAIALLLTFITTFLKFPQMVSDIITYIVSLVISPVTSLFMLTLLSNLKQIKGDFIYAPNNNEKTFFICMIIVGILSVVLLPLLAVTYLPYIPFSQFQTL